MKYIKEFNSFINNINENIYKDTADRLLGIDDDWGYSDIEEHLIWLINNPTEIADGYNRSAFKMSNVDKIMKEVQKLLKNK